MRVSANPIYIDILSVMFFLCMYLMPLAQPLHYRFSEDILNTLDKDTSSYKYLQAAWDLANIGDYENVLKVWDMQNLPPGVLLVADSERFLQLKAVSALDYIISRAKREQIIIINEAHHQPNHRVFAESLLDSLYSIGYRYFGAETLNPRDSLLNARKYPIMNTGYYSVQPQFANLIRTALKDSFHVFAYEASTLANGKEREIEQAQNIKAVLDKDSGAKMIIYCGFDHLIKSDVPDWGKAMAGRLRDFTGINPFTIDQVRLTERGSLQNDNPFYKMVNLNYYAVFVDSSGSPFNGPKGLNQYDVRVYHPRTSWINGRPNWVFESKRLPFFVDGQLKIPFPCLIFAYNENEDRAIAIPADVIELKNENEKIALSLVHGNYTIVIKNKAGQEQIIKATL